MKGGKYMETPIPSTVSWFRDRYASTGGPFINCVQHYALAATLFIGTGTGAFVDDLNLLRSHQENKTISRPSHAYEHTRTHVEDIERIRKVFSPAISDLAKTFSVSRQAIYNWLNGEQAKTEHIAKVRELARAADMFAEAAISVNGVLLKRKLVTGKNLFEVVQTGGSAQDAAQLLINIIRRETSQRETLTSRFADRKSPIRSADSDLIAENDAV